MADSASYADCRDRATPQRSRGARANEHVAASKPRGEGDTARRNSENILRISRARPGRRPVRLETRCLPGRRRVRWESHRPGRAWARDFENITRWAGRGLGQARSAPPGSTPPPRVGPTSKNRWISSIGFFTNRKYLEM